MNEQANDETRIWPSPFNRHYFEFEFPIPGDSGSPWRQARMFLPRDFTLDDVEVIAAFLRDLAERPTFPPASRGRRDG